MKLILASHLEPIVNILSKEPSARDGHALVVANARDYLSNDERRRAIEEKLSTLRKAGINAVLLDLQDYFDDNTGLVELFNRVNPFAIIAIGGDTLYLSTAMQLSGFDKIMREKVENKDFIYAGSSAGAVVASKDLSFYGSTSVIDRYNSKTSMQGLGLIDFYVVPHFNEDGFENETFDSTRNLRGAHADVRFILQDGAIELEINKLPDKNELFDAWNIYKKRLDAVGRTPAIKDGEVWWGAVGENIGSEINGKNEKFSRPILVLRKLSRYTFMGIPLTSQEKEGDWFVRFTFKDKIEYAAVCQARVFSVSRLYTKIGTLPKSDLELVQDGFLRLYGKR